MEVFEGEGICLRAVDFGENDKILTLYMAQKGKIAVKARGCKSAKSKLKFAATPMCFGKYYIVGKGNLLSGCDMIDSFYTLAYDTVKFYCACAVLEIADKMSMEEDYNHALFVEILDTLKDLCYTAQYPKVCLFSHLRKISLSLGYEVKAITLKEYYNYFCNTHSVKINSLRQLIKLDDFNG